ncbi:MAG: hypothetical protein ACK4TK_07930 [Thiobacillaceae bacterium]
MQLLRAWFFTLALLWAQLAGALHALSHVHDTEDDPGHPVCEWCVAYGGVQHGAAAHPPPIAAVVPSHAPEPGVWDSHPQAPVARPYSIRAPPTEPV